MITSRKEMQPQATYAVFDMLFQLLRSVAGTSSLGLIRHYRCVS